MSNLTSNPVEYPAYDPNDPRPLPEIVAEFYGFPLANADDTDGNRYYAVQDWIRGVTETYDVRNLWAKLKRRMVTAGVDMSPWRLQLPYRASDGKNYTVDYAPATGLYQITQRMDAN